MASKKKSATDKWIEKVSKLAGELTGQYEDLRPDQLSAFYALRKGESSTFHRLGGLPTGGASLEWPCRGGEPMTHVLTIDLASMPEVRERVAGDQATDEVRALSLFVHSPQHNEAFAPGNDATRVLLIGEGLAEQEATPPEGSEVLPVESVETVRIEVLSVLFAAGWSGGKKLKNAMEKLPAMAGGNPSWIQKPQRGKGPFILQFDERFADVNVGDRGRMYVFSDTAFFQCH